MMSQPASACTSAWRTRACERLVVEDLAAAHQPVVAVAGVGVERHVEQHADVEPGLADGAGRAAHEVVGIEGLAAVVGAQLRVRVGEEGDDGNAERHRLARSFDREVDAEPVDARHRLHRLLHVLGLRRRKSARSDRRP